MSPMSPPEIKLAVEQVQDRMRVIEHDAWDKETLSYRCSHTAMWIEASQIIPKEWREIIRVLAQGGEYYSIEW